MNKKQMKEHADLRQAVKACAAIGTVLCESEKDANEWRVRMMKAGLKKYGLSFPEDWDSLTEAEKTKRLDAALRLM